MTTAHYYTSPTGSNIVNIHEIKSSRSNNGTPNHHSSIAINTPVLIDEFNKIENRLNRARSSYLKKMAVERQLGLTPFDNTCIDGKFTPEDLQKEVDFRRNNFWKSCCGNAVDKRVIQYLVQIGIGVMVMGFCMAKIWTIGPKHSCEGEDPAVYIALFSAVIGYFLPSPSLRK
jgi:hypothetical protein